MSVVPDQDPVEVLAGKLAIEIPNIRAAQARTEAWIADAAQRIVDGRILPSGHGDASIIVFGSLARGEAVEGSDADWALLADGRADPSILRTAMLAERMFLDLKLSQPGTTGVFGQVIHAGELLAGVQMLAEDSPDITRRVLLLLESRPVGPSAAWERTTRAVLGGYLDPTLRYSGDGTPERRVPRFLLNDLLRYWRTVAVEFTAKHQRRGGAKWGLRMAKLRMSRKLIAGAGYLACLRNEARADRPGDFGGDDVEFFEQVLVRPTPLQIVADTCLRYDVDSEISRSLLEPYDTFLGIIGDPAKRGRLADLSVEEAPTEPLFSREVWALGARFEQALTALLFDHPAFKSLTRKYGVL